MGCKQSREDAHAVGRGGVNGAAGAAPVRSCPQLPAPVDDVVPFVTSFGDSHFAASGLDGCVYFYDWKSASLGGAFRAHGKSTNRLLHLDGNRLLTASDDATVKLWGSSSGSSALPDAAAAAGASVASLASAFPADAQRTFAGHRISVMGLAKGSADGAHIFSGSRDCTVRLWDLETGSELRQVKVLRNVVTAARRVDGGEASRAVVQASEDLQLRLWDASDGGLRAAHAVHAGPNQLICLDVTDDGRYVVCGSKGFSRENCCVKVFDVRGGLRELHSLPCADQTIEAVHVVGPDRCLIASKDCYLRAVSLQAPAVVAERGPSSAGYTALGVARRGAGSGPVALSASVAAGDPPLLELLAFGDPSLREPAQLLASTT
eukprot:TRINITY_DN74019_c0_g1_i1.p1 TRINITY_DN74019_c0_g1~~TRINITY_DN74019_c0_g1_i1.p1  ORF type:complete len:396 (+),score=87.56 TRINITY_DN74019_c0_g1_i1:60-1190(+)